ncbi:hypothetical protein NUW54_g6983 [Trametes sanguinea]|uniref:Uncharacterized protein n=1 Tax=Trametes sanguinea TaxID=158606 RepID=A0ACC1PQS6_9APHY|nr:hypothetical protein NUW54_g6983 [Trametes sanguinea]
MAHRDWVVSVCGLLALALALMCRRAQDGLPRLLSPLKISVLWLHLSKTMSPAVRPVSELNGDATDAQKVRVIEARQMELSRLAVMPDLPRRLAEAIPSLRYLAIVDDGPNLATLALPVDGDLSRGDSGYSQRRRGRPASRGVADDRRGPSILADRSGGVGFEDLSACAFQRVGTCTGGDDFSSSAGTW